MTHAFLADMGAFVLHHPDSEEFPLTAKHVHYLVTEGYISYTDVGLERRFIDDRNKGDGTARFITVCQMLWFSVNCFGRVAQGLAITTIELTTLGFIVCTLGTYFFWARKPMDVGSAILLVPNVSVQQILEKAGEKGKEPYYSTPLDFVGRDLSSWAVYWAYWVNILARFSNVFLHNPKKIRDDNFLPLSQPTTFVLFLSQIAFAVVQICGWNLHYPTSTERLLWRISSLAILGSILTYWVIEGFTWRILPALKSYMCRHQNQAEDIERKPGVKENDTPPEICRLSRAQQIVAKRRNNSKDNDPALEVPLTVILPLCFLGAIYCTSRAYILLEDLMSLRELPESAYQSPNWSNFLPHL